MSDELARLYNTLAKEIYAEETTLEGLLLAIDEAVSEQGMPSVAADCLRMMVLDAYDMVEDAAIPGARLVQEAADHMPSLLIYVDLLLRMKEFDQGREILTRARQQWPQSWNLLEYLITLEVFAQRLETAQELVREARLNKVLDARGEDLESQIDKAMSGPHWPKTYRFSSKHYLVESDISEAICKEAASLLEGAYTSYSVRLQRITNLENNKFRVFLFSGEASYQRYVGESLGADAENTAGLFSGFLKQLLIWNVPKRESMMQTVVHEGFHQYLDLAAFRAPNWFNEGMAEYIEAAELVNGRWTDGQVRHDHLENLKKKTMMPLADFVNISARRFYAGDVGLHYSQAWAFIHFLRNSSKKEGDLFDRLFKGFVESPSSGQVVRDAFEDVDMAALDEQLLAYLEELRND